MARTIHKFELTAESEFTVEMPRGAKVLSVGVQREVVCLWVLVDTDNPKDERTFLIWGTGHSIDSDTGTYIGTVILQDGAIVWHVFEEG